MKIFLHGESTKMYAQATLNSRKNISKRLGGHSMVQSIRYVADLFPPAQHLRRNRILCECKLVYVSDNSLKLA